MNRITLIAQKRAAMGRVIMAIVGEELKVSFLPATLAAVIVLPQ